MTILCTGLTWWLAAGPARADTAPSDNGLPTISGIAQQGEVLTADPGTWSGDSPISFSYQWSDGQTGSTATLSAADVGDSLTVTVTASNAFGQNSATSDSVGPILPPPPAPGDPPVITGTAQQGDTLSVSNGTWGNNPTGFTYVWQDCDTSGGSCVGITGAISSIYTLQASDVGKTIVASVTASSAGGQASASSAASAPVLPAAPVATKAPGISGTAQQGKTLTVSNGTWSNNPSAFTYVWRDCDSLGNNCAPITGATSTTYTLRASDVRQTIVASVTASNAGGQTSASSSSVGPVLPVAPVNSVKPVVSGTAQQGATLSVSTGTWSGDPTAFAYEWQDCSSSGTNCVAIAGATSSSYTVRASDVGGKILAIVTASNAGGQNAATSASAGPVLPAAPVDTTAPGITGTAQQGKTLTVSNGAWVNNPTAFAYVWQDCTSISATCSAISGATSNTYTLQGSDAHKYVSVTVTASNSGGRTSVTTASVGPVLPPAPVNTQTPVITGTDEQGDTLSVSNGTWSNNPTGYAYAWERCNSSGANCVAIGGATSSSYVLSVADVGRTIACVITATGAGGNTSVTTTQTSVVVASPIPVASQPTTTDLLATPSTPVTNQSVTLVATVSASTSSTALWGTVTFENGGAPIPGCANMPAAPSGTSATVACSTSFAASTAQLTAGFTPTSGSILKSSASPGERLTIAPDTTSTSLAASPSVSLGETATYTATVGPPTARPGPVVPTGWVEFLDGGEPILACAGQLLTNGVATCAITYVVSGAHQITARYSGDANFAGSTSPAAQVNAAPVPTTVLGTIASTMQWNFYYTPTYTLVRNLVLNAALPGSTVVVRCQGHGCPFAQHATVLATGARCGPKSGMCFSSGRFNLTPGFAGRRLAIGARITVNVVQPNWIGKSYRFAVRSRRGPRVQIGCLAPGASVPGVGC